MTVVKDEQLMLAVGKGDLDSFKEIVHRHQRAAWGVAYRFLGDPAEAEDIAQETFLRVLEAAPRYRPTANFHTYLYRIVTRLCIDCARKKRPMLTSELPEIIDCFSEPSATLVVKERDIDVRRAMDGLPPKQRMAVILRYYEGLGYADIARAMGITVKAVERLLYRARAALRPRLSLKKGK